MAWLTATVRNRAFDALRQRRPDIPLHWQDADGEERSFDVHRTRRPAHRGSAWPGSRGARRRWPRCSGRPAWQCAGTTARPRHPGRCETAASWLSGRRAPWGRPSSRAPRRARGPAGRRAGSALSPGPGAGPGRRRCGRSPRGCSGPPAHPASAPRPDPARRRAGHRPACRPGRQLEDGLISCLSATDVKALRRVMRRLVEGCAK